MNNIQKLQAKLNNDACAAIIYSPHNRYYFTGFQSSDGLLVVTKKRAVFLVDSRYIEAAKKQIHDCEVELLVSTTKQLPPLLESLGADAVGIEALDMPVSTAQRFINMLPKMKFDISDGLSNTISRLRMIKTASEIENMKKAQEITDAAFKYILDYIKPGVAERDIALEIEYFMKKHGASGPSFELITITGENTSIPHGVPGELKIKNGDFFTMDIGAIVNSYCSDMTRTVAVGKISDEQKKVYDTVLKAQIECEEMCGPGVGCDVIDQKAREIIKDAGLPVFGHALGHSVGLQIHEEPRLSPTCKIKLEPGMTMTVEPGVYIEGKFGVRIEDMVLITESGKMVFTQSPKELITL